MSGLTRVNQQRSTANSRTSTPGTPSGYHSAPGGSSYPPASGYGGGPGSGFQAGAGPGAGFGPGAGLGAGLGGSGRASPFARPGSGTSQYSESPFGGGMSSSGMGFNAQAGPSFGAYRPGGELEQHNDDLLTGLLGKVNTLKDLTKGIGKEVRDGNLELAGMNDTFGSTGNMLSGTFKRMTKMARRQGSNWCYFMGFLLLVLWIFIVVWWLRR